MELLLWVAAIVGDGGEPSGSKKWFTDNDAETIFERLEAQGKTWKVYVMEPMPALCSPGIIDFPRLKDRRATDFVPFAEFDKDVVAGHPSCTSH